jgi:hypothetical protein
MRTPLRRRAGRDRFNRSKQRAARGTLVESGLARAQQMQANFESQSREWTQAWEWRPWDGQRSQGAWFFTNHIGKRLNDSRRHLREQRCRHGEQDGRAQ